MATQRIEHQRTIAEGEKKLEAERTILRQKTLIPLNAVPKLPSPYGANKSHTQLVLEGDQKSNRKVLKPLEHTPAHGSESSDEDPPNYLDVILGNHDKSRASLQGRNKSALANPVPSALQPPQSKTVGRNIAVKQKKLTKTIEPPSIQADLESSVKVPQPYRNASIASLDESLISASAAAGGGELPTRRIKKKVVKKKKKGTLGPGVTVPQKPAEIEKDGKKVVIHGLSEVKAAR